MKVLVLAAALALALAAAAPARADEPEELKGATAEALAIQALNILDQGASHEEAIERLELALEEAGGQEEVDPARLREALAALQAEDPGRAEEALRAAFAEDDVHAVGVTYRPGREAARVGAGIAGAVVLGLAALGLVGRRRDGRAR